ncbi:RWP-RK domain-containing protein [Tribonema minus]|uniref:RWP-RK domain-containing protein n=1 Tax=Tribonema minus TaxID=303371 RepID=A0A835YMV4_9STRA|nr:RWP-RK domain-containing protein [Tribonema minus]
MSIAATHFGAALAPPPDAAYTGLPPQGFQPRAPYQVIVCAMPPAAPAGAAAAAAAARGTRPCANEYASRIQQGPQQMVEVAAAAAGGGGGVQQQRSVSPRSHDQFPGAWTQHSAAQHDGSHSPPAAAGGTASPGCYSGAAGGDAPFALHTSQQQMQMLNDYGHDRRHAWTGAAAGAAPQYASYAPPPPHACHGPARPAAAAAMPVPESFARSSNGSGGGGAAADGRHAAVSADNSGSGSGDDSDSSGSGAAAAAAAGAAAPPPPPRRQRDSTLRRAGWGGGWEGGGDGSVGVPLLRTCFHLPIVDAAHKLGMCVTALKKICRQHGIKRWPFRQVQSLQKTIESLQVASQQPHLSDFDRKRYDTQIQLAAALQVTQGSLLALLQSPHGTAVPPQFAAGESPPPPVADTSDDNNNQQHRQQQQQRR